MKCFSEKVYLEITPPTEEDTKSDQHRICQTLSDVGYKNAKSLFTYCKSFTPCAENVIITSQ